MSLNKTQLIDAVAKEAGLKKKDAEQAINSTFGAITNELSDGGNVTLIGFGTFSTFERSARKGKNPQSGKEINIPAKTVAKFKPGKALKDAVDGNAKKGKKAKKK